MNTTNALADIAYFIEEMNKTQAISSSKWVVIGGSYPGGMAAEFRHLYPTHAAAAWSSSGTVLSKEYYNEYDMSVYLSAKKSDNDCPKKFSMVMTDIERILMFGNQTEKDAMYAKFYTNNTSMDNGDFMAFISDIFSGAVQYGLRTKICDWLNTTAYKEDPFGQLMAWNLQDSRLYPNEYDGVVELANTTVDFTKNMRQYAWQDCTEFGKF